VPMKFYRPTALIPYVVGPIIAASAQAADLSPQWFGTWKASEDTELVISAKKFQIKLGPNLISCDWVADDKLPKKKGCWALYEGRLTVADMQKRAIDDKDPETAPILNQLSKSSTFRVVRIVDTDLKGARVDTNSECQWSYFFDEGSVYLKGDCKAGDVSFLSLVRFLKV
jgi:hypothetical protein